MSHLLICAEDFGLKEDKAACDIETKDFGPFEIKDEAKGEVVAVVATLGEVDRDGDVILPGSIRNGSPVILSDYGHNSVLDGKAPVGKGTISEEGTKAVLRGRFFLSSQRGREAFLTVKELGEHSEWSIGFPHRSVKTAPMTEEYNTKGARRLIVGLEAMEASPVLRGAQLGTRTMVVKEEASAEEIAAREREQAEAAERAVIEAKEAAELAELKRRRDAEIVDEEYARFERTRRRHTIL
jgi:hypothetical protein